MPNFTAIDQTVTDIIVIFRLSKWRSFAILHLLYACLELWTTHDEYLVVFITVQNLVGIDVVVVIICTC